MADWDSEFQVMFVPATGMIRIELRRKSDNGIVFGFDVTEEGARLFAHQLVEAADLRQRNALGKHVTIVPQTDPGKKN